MEDGETMGKTDAEIIKALECCSKAQCEQDCVVLGCPYYLEEQCSNKIVVDALDLINRKDAEIERLKEELDGETVTNMRLGHEIERYKSNEKFINEKCDSILEKAKKIPYALKMDVAQAKSEAYKEFAEGIVKELKSSAIVYTCLINKKQTNHGFLIDDVFYCVDNTLKKLMKG